MINLWKARNKLIFGYLNPVVVVKPNEMLFMVGKTGNELVFKTEDGIEVLLPLDAEKRGRIERVF